MFPTCGGKKNSEGAKGVHLNPTSCEKLPTQIVFMGTLTDGGQNRKSPWNRRGILSEWRVSCQDQKTSGGLRGNPLLQELEQFVVEVGLCQDREGSFTQSLMAKLIRPICGDQNERDFPVHGVLAKSLEKL